MLAPSLAAAGDVVLRRFNSGPGSDVFLLDQVNGRVLRFDPRQPAGQTRSFTLPEALEPTGLVVRKGEIFVWDGSVHALRPTGANDAPTRGLAEFQTRGIDAPFVVSAFSFHQRKQEPRPALGRI